MTNQTENQKKVFIAGKISGLEMQKVREKFNRREKELKALGYCVINPVERIKHINEVKSEIGEDLLDAVEDRKYIMGVCLYDLSTCDELHLLHDWCASNGSVELFEFAQRHDMKIVFELECDHTSSDLSDQPEAAPNKAFEREPLIFSRNLV